MMKEYLSEILRNQHVNHKEFIKLQLHRELLDEESFDKNTVISKEGIELIDSFLKQIVDQISKLDNMLDEIKYLYVENLLIFHTKKHGIYSEINSYQNVLDKLKHLMNELYFKKELVFLDMLGISLVPTGDITND